ncbi:hypothetical protein FDI24_gp025 [Acidovorax phage ACP17]|uniref:Uncharacterized protein n=1 Tax=Acidovorax phage ACP17 TaxID=2010329 RepID=A0A218M3E4_9CAUD|nr:hypothetical protein FDI24_gp025 [Acidovorax phage ACP17]ASD50559.1 hypothetical protein [Acidovorax phage ACP17]
MSRYNPNRKNELKIILATADGKTVAQRVADKPLYFDDEEPNVKLIEMALDMDCRLSGVSRVSYTITARAIKAVVK